MKSRTDKELMILYQKAADEKAFDELYRRYSGRLWGYLVKRINCTSVAEDMLQTVFMTLHKNKGKFNPKYPFSSWIFTICRNVMIDTIRKNKNREVVADLEQFASATPEYSITVIPTEALQQLPKTQRTVIQLRYLSGMSFESIAQKINKTTENVRQMTSRGIKKLRKILKG